LLMSDPEVTLDGDPEPYRLPGSDQIYYRAKILRKKLYGCPKIEACPPEEIVWTPDARSLKEAPLVAHVREVPRDELIAMGIDPEIVENKEGRKRATASDHLEDVRQFHGGNRQREMSDERDDSQ